MFVAALKGSQCGMAALELLLTLPPAYLAAVLRDRPADALLGVGSQTAALLSLAACQDLARLASLRLLRRNESRVMRNNRPSPGSRLCGCCRRQPR